jgi:tetrahydromethanopterin S-methyltransferase subunit G
MQIEELAEIVIGVGKKVDNLEVRFDGVDQKLEALDKKIDDRVDELAAMTARGFSEVNARIDGVEDRLEGVGDRLEGVEGRLENVDGSIRILGNKIDTTRSDLKSAVFDHGKLKMRG